ncbi:molybdenum cofactor biosynthesis protein MoeB [Capsulimonas corticalis]|uniref:Molybdenum cofactor biosynthesis protein MoeB n=1 Tax=Capsulimonas corticalis TaxID=2219043 RepID=A0A402CP51_9BACT|nr:molybdopterin-synthase adenylyltransferase MoeB [Capsulimonas corticalis]BDI33199.1 molybdenum cofactor biosynthesis protein MoeB [Capsulimonas corticalis]
MAVKIVIPTPMQRYANNQEEINAEGVNVGEALTHIATQFPDLRKHVFNEDGTIRSFVNVYVNDEDSRYSGGDATQIKDGDTLTIVPSIAGGIDAVGHGGAPSFHLAADPDEVEFTNDEILRYSRHLIMPEVTLEGQKRLKAAKVLCIGTGGLGAPLTMYLAAAGVGTIGLVDFDIVDLTNLQRQIVHRESTVGTPKIDSAEQTLKEINPHVNIIKHEVMLTSENALEILKDYDVIADGTDNFQTRYLVNDACVLLGKPNVYGSIFRFEGQATVFFAKDGPCYRCLYPEPPPPGLVPSCAEGGVLGVLPGIIGVIQAIEAVKLILSEGKPLIGRLMLFDALKMSFRELKLRKNPECPVCGEHPTVTALIDYDEFCGIGRGGDAPQVLGKSEEITAKELKARFDRGDKFTLVDVREPHEYAIAKIPGAKLVPLATVADRLHEFDKDSEIVLQCKMGGRSAKALQIFKDAGFKHLQNLTGGITAWSDDVDPSVPKY